MDAPRFARTFGIFEATGRVGKVLDKILVDNSEKRSAVVAIRLLMLTGCRLSEIQKLKWKHVDLDAGELRLIDIKTGGRSVPLVASAVRRWSVSPVRGYSLGDRGQELSGFHLTYVQHPCRRIRERDELPDVRIYHLSHSFCVPCPGDRRAPSSDRQAARPQRY